MHQSIDKKNKIGIYLIFLIILSTTSNKNIKTNEDYSLSINNINVTGLPGGKNLQVAQQLNKLLNENIFFANESIINGIILQYNSVESYTVKKIYPKKIHVEIKPTRFIARIENDTSLMVGANGKIIENGFVNEDLPLLVGEFSSKKFLKLKKIVENSEFKFTNFKSIIFHPSKTIDIEMIEGILIKLPEKNLTESLRIAFKAIKNDTLKVNKIINLRILDRIITQK
jgi:cell division protein FtsQ